MEPITKVTQILQRDDGSEVKIVAEAMYGVGLHLSIGVYVLRRESSSHEWSMTCDRPHPGWKTMPRDEYVKRGRSEMLCTVTHGEILKVTRVITAT